MVLVKWLIAYYSPLVLTTLRATFAAAVLGLLICVSHQSWKVPKASWKYLAGAAVCSIYLHQLTLAFGLEQSHASTAALIVGLIPLLTSLLTTVFFKGKLGWQMMLAVVSGFFGLFIVVNAGSWHLQPLTFGKGEGLVFLGAFSYACGNLFVKKASETVPSLVVTGYMHMLAFLLLWLTVGVTGQQMQLVPSGFVWTLLLFSAIGPSAIATLGWNVGIRRLGPAYASLFLNGVPVASLIHSVLFLQESIYPAYVIGFLFIITGITVVSRRPQGKVEKGI